MDVDTWGWVRYGFGQSTGIARYARLVHDRGWCLALVPVSGTGTPVPNTVPRQKNCVILCKRTTQLSALRFDCNYRTEHLPRLIKAVSEIHHSSDYARLNKAFSSIR